MLFNLIVFFGFISIPFLIAASLAVILTGISVYLFQQLKGLKKQRLTLISQEVDSEVHLNAFIDQSSKVNFYALDEKYRYTYLNGIHKQEMKEVFGVDAEVGKHKLKLLPEPWRSQYQALYDKALKGNHFTHTQKANDRFLAFVFNPVHSKNGKITGLTVAVHDATEKIKDQQELEEYRNQLEDLVKKRTDDVIRQRNFFQSVIDQDPNLIFVRNPQGNYVWINKAAADSLQKDVTEVIGKSVLETHRNRDLAKLFLKEDQEILADDRLVTKEEKTEWVDGSTKWLFLNKRRININGKPYILGVHTDITHLKKTEYKLQQTNQELEKTLHELKNMQLNLIESEKMASIGQLTAGLAHEINNPINYVSGNVEPLRYDIEDLKKWINQFCPDPEDELKKEFEETFNEIEALLGGIEEGASRVKKLMSNLKSFSKPEKNESARFNIAEVMSSTINLMAPSVKNRIRFKYEPISLSLLNGNVSKLQQVFLNLFDNAIQAIKEQGTIEVNTRELDDKIEISIKDSGKGIAPEIQQKIFDPFFTTNEVGKGTGLGLSISQRIVNEHKGSISVQSKIGEGTEFIISLPK
jgi:PAS domain S-box-containing protein